MARASGPRPIGLKWARAFSLTEIRELPALSSHRDEDMAGMKSAAIPKRADVETKLAELGRIREGLRTLVASCPGHGASALCPILDALAEKPE